MRRSHESNRASSEAFAPVDLVLLAPEHDDGAHGAQDLVGDGPRAGVRGLLLALQVLHELGDERCAARCTAGSRDARGQRTVSVQRPDAPLRARARVHAPPAMARNGETANMTSVSCQPLKKPMTKPVKNCAT